MADQVDANGWAPLDPVVSHTPAAQPAPNGTPGVAEAQPYVWSMPPYAPAPPPPRSRLAEVPPGTPYHRLARTSRQRWWQPIAGTLAILAAGILAMVLVMVAIAVGRVALTGDEPPILDGSGDDDSIFGNATADLGFNLFSLALFLPFILLAVWIFQRRRPGMLSSVAGGLRWRWLLVCAGVAVLACVGSFGGNWAVSLVVDDPTADSAETWVGWSRFLAPAVVILLVVPFQAAAEEYFFRGWLLQCIAGCTLETRRARLARLLSVVFRTPWPAIVISGAVFVTGHGYTGWGMVDIFCFALVTGWLAVRTGGLEAPIAFHVLNNLMAFLLPAAVGKLDIEQGAVPWQYVMADLIPMVLFAAAVVWLARRRQLVTVTAAAPAP